MTEEGIHAVLLVLSVKTRVSEEEESTINTLQSIFDSKILDYCIVVFTGGDELEQDNQTLDDFFSAGCPEVLKVCLFILIFTFLLVKQYIFHLLIALLEAPYNQKTSYGKLLEAPFLENNYMHAPLHLFIYILIKLVTNFQKALRLCHGRKVVFNNRTTDEEKKAEQITKLLALVADIGEKTGGIPYTYQMHLKIKVKKGDE